jgi:CheY-like chemotaxis protein
MDLSGLDDSMQSNAESGPPRVLLVEDDVKLVELVQEYLRRYEFEVNLEHRGNSTADRVG